MKSISTILILIVLASTLTNCGSQNQSVKDQNTGKKQVGGGCDGCELMYVGMPASIPSIDTSAGWNESGQKLYVSGTVYQLDGKTPAPNVVIYFWQTDNTGHYSPKEGMDQQAKRHGHIRGWLKSDENGKYALYTIRPSPYPKNDMPAHIHLAIKEPNIADEYYIDELVFDDDILLTEEKRTAIENRGGSGILRIMMDKNRQLATRDIILGRNIPNYPTPGNH